MANKLEDFMKLVPMNELASKFGVDEADINKAVSLAAPALVGGMAVNASTDEGASKLVNAASKHNNRAASLADVDTTDGQKIVKKVLGAKEEDVTNAVASQADSAGIAALIPKLLPVIAPLLMQFLAGSLSSSGSQAQSQPQSSTGGIGDILGGLLGGGQGGGIDSVLGGLLGGSNSNSTGGLGGIFGALLGK